MQSQLNKALKLAKKTGDRLIVFEGPESENAFVVMNLEQYEDLLECTGCGDDCECDHDHDHEYEDDASIDFDDESMEPANFDYASELRNLTEEELLDKINRDIALWKESQKEVESQEISTEKLEENQGAEESGSNKSKWAIKSEVKENADEIIEEDRHYLEEVKF